MILSDVIGMVDDIKPNAFTNATKTKWINEVEGLVQTEVMLLAVDDVITYDYANDSSAELLVAPPHDKIYWAYLSALIDFANGEYNKYANTMQLFNSYYSEYMRWYAATYHPADGAADDVGYYISAYGIAVKNGYTGTEQEWLASLVGPQGDSVGLRYDSDVVQWQHAGDAEWTDLIDVDDIRGAVITATVTAAEAAQAAAVLAKTAAETARDAALEAQTDVDEKLAEQTAATSLALIQAENVQNAKAYVDTAARTVAQAINSVEQSQSFASSALSAANTAKSEAQAAKAAAVAAAEDAQGAVAVLSGGTTGQLVSKASDGNYDFDMVSLGNTLKLVDGVIDVDTATAAEADNSKAITSAAVYTEIGNIAVLLAAL